MLLTNRRCSMPRPKTKAELLAQSQANFHKLFELIDAYPPGRQEGNFEEGTLNRNIRDVLAHLHEWHIMMASWYKVGMDGEKPDMPASGYTWKTLPALNQKIWEESQAISLQEARELLNTSFITIQAIVQQHSDEELFEKKRYKWTGSTSLGAYLISSTASHYDWAYKLIKKKLPKT